MIDRFVQRLKSSVILSLVEPSGRSLDIGCGDKRYTMLLPDPVGIDLNPEFEGRRNSPDLLMDACNLGFPDSSFTNVLMADVLEHVPETGRVIREVYRILKPRGALIIIDPEDRNLLLARLLALRLWDAFRGNPDHKHRFNEEGLKRALGGGFRLRKKVKRFIFTGYKFIKQSRVSSEGFHED